MSVAQIIVPIFLLILLGVAMHRWFGLRSAPLRISNRKRPK